MVVLKIIREITIILVKLPNKLTFVTCLFNGLALQNKNRGIKIILKTDIKNKPIEPYSVAFGHLMIEASIIPI